MKIGSFEEARAVLRTFVPSERQFREAYTLDRMRTLMAALGNPQDNYKVIHIAGTSGKTSTAYYTAALLQQTGVKVGMTVSPHIDEVNERVQINLRPLPERKFCRALGTFIELINNLHIKPTYFELLVAFAFWQFAQEQVGYAVVEVGLGGLLDGTNVVHRPDKLCVITDIGMDHTNVLGSTIPEIAAQKAGIIRPNNVVFSYRQKPAVMAVLREVANSQQAELHEVLIHNPDILPGNLPLFQRRNWYLAHCVVDYVQQRDSLPPISDERQFKSTRVYVPARMEIIRRHNKTLVLDGAHNPQKMAALVQSLQERFPQQKFTILLGLVHGKNLRIKHVLQKLLPITERLIVTSFETEQDLRKYSSRPRKIAEYANDVGLPNVQIVDQPEDAYRVLLEGDSSRALITGSFYLLNHIRPLVFKEKPHD